MTHAELLIRAAALKAETIESNASDLFAPCPRCGAPDGILGCTCPIPTVELYYAAALPLHMIAVTRMGYLWLVPAGPIGPNVWDAAVEYHGNYDVTRVPAPIEAMYGQPETQIAPQGRAR